MVKDHSNNERGNSLPPLDGLVFLIRSGQVRSCQVMSGQVRVINVHIQSKLL